MYIHLVFHKGVGYRSCRIPGILGSTVLQSMRATVLENDRPKGSGCIKAERLSVSLHVCSSVWFSEE